MGSNYLKTNHGGQSGALSLSDAIRRIYAQGCRNSGVKMDLGSVIGGNASAVENPLETIRDDVADVVGIELDDGGITTLGGGDAGRGSGTTEGIEDGSVGRATGQDTGLDEIGREHGEVGTTVS